MFSNGFVRLASLYFRAFPSLGGPEIRSRKLLPHWVALGMLASQAVMASVDEAGLTYVKDLVQKSQWPEAVLQLRALASDYGALSEADLLFAYVLVQLNRRGEALAHLRRKVPTANGTVREKLLSRMDTLAESFLSRKSSQLYQDALSRVSANEIEGAKQLLSQILDLEPDNVRVLKTLSQLEIEREQSRSALERLRKIMDLHPTDPDLAAWLGRAHLKVGDYLSALGELQSAYQKGLNPIFMPSWFAEALNGTGKTSEAVEILQTDLVAHPDSVPSLVGWAKMKLIDPTSRLEDYRQASLKLEKARGLFDQFRKDHPCESISFPKEMDRLTTQLGEAMTMLAPKSET